MPKKKNISEKKPRINFHLSRQAAGIILTAAACLLFWFPYPYIHRSFLFKSYKVLSLQPTLISGFFALTLILCLYIRGIFTIKNTTVTFVAFLTNLTLFATIFEIFISPEQNQTVASTVSPIKAALLSFCAAAILLGVREIAKTVFFLLISGMLFFRLKLVSDAMGIFGYIAFLSLIFKCSFARTRPLVICFSNFIKSKAKWSIDIFICFSNVILSSLINLASKP